MITVNIVFFNNLIQLEKNFGNLDSWNLSIFQSTDLVIEKTQDSRSEIKISCIMVEKRLTKTTDPTSDLFFYK